MHALWTELHVAGSWTMHWAYVWLPLALLLGLRWTRARRDAAGRDYDEDTLVLVSGSLELVALMVVLRPLWMVRDTRWQILVAVLPLLMVAYHAVNLWRERLTPPERTGGQLEPSRGRVAASIQYHYRLASIVARYVLPAMLLAIVGAAEFYLLAIRDTTLPSSPEYIHGLRGLGPALVKPFKYGLVGAYSFVFIELGKRSIRNDITPISIVWCLITLIVGPTLAVLIPSIFKMTQPGNWNDCALWVFAGYSPRIILRALTQGMMKSLQSESSVVQETRQIPLGRIDGIGADEADRLAEEGIQDAHGLACVDPVRLMRDTRFDNWRIVSWVDQALLLVSVPEEVWQALLKRGFQRATETEILVCKRAHDEGTVQRMSVFDAKAVLDVIADEVGARPKEAVADMLARLIQDPRTTDLEVLTQVLGRVQPETRVATLEPTHARVHEPITIHGSGFGAARGTVRFGDTPASEIERWADDAITVRVPAVAKGAPLPVSVTPARNGHAFAADSLFRVDGPDA